MKKKALLAVMILIALLSVLSACSGSIESITVDTMPKANYVLGEALDVSGGVILVKYASGKSKPVDMDSPKVSTSGYNKNVVGEQVITVKYLKMVTTFVVTVEAPVRNVTGIEIVNLPTLRTYEVGDSLIFDGGEIRVSYHDETSEVIPMDSSRLVVVYDFSVAGEREVEVKLGEFSVKFNVTVNEKPVVLTPTSIAVETMPGQITYAVGGTFNPQGGSIRVFYDNQTSEVIPMSSDKLTIIYNFSVTGKREVEVKLGELSVKFDVTVTEEAVAKSISIKTMPANISDYYVGDSIDVTGGELIVHYSDNSEVVVPMDAEGVELIYDNSQAGSEIRVEIHYLGFTTEFKVSFQALTAVSISIYTNPDKVKYFIGQPLNTEGGTILVTYNNGSTTVLPMNYPGVETIYSFMFKGMTTVTVIYLTFQAQFQVEVTGVYAPDWILLGQLINDALFYYDAWNDTLFVYAYLQIVDIVAEITAAGNPEYNKQYQTNHQGRVDTLSNLFDRYINHPGFLDAELRPFLRAFTRFAYRWESKIYVAGDFEFNMDAAEVVSLYMQLSDLHKSVGLLSLKANRTYQGKYTGAWYFSYLTALYYNDTMTDEDASCYYYLAYADIYCADYLASGDHLYTFLTSMEYVFAMLNEYDVSVKWVNAFGAMYTYLNGMYEANYNKIPMEYDWSVMDLVADEIKQYEGSLSTLWLSFYYMLSEEVDAIEATGNEVMINYLHNTYGTLIEYCHTVAYSEYYVFAHSVFDDEQLNEFISYFTYTSYLYFYSFREEYYARCSTMIAMFNELNPFQVYVLINVVRGDGGFKTFYTNTLIEYYHYHCKIALTVIQAWIGIQHGEFYYKRYLHSNNPEDYNYWIQYVEQGIANYGKLSEQDKGQYREFFGEWYDYWYDIYTLTPEIIRDLVDFVNGPLYDAYYLGVTLSEYSVYMAQISNLVDMVTEYLKQPELVYWLTEIPLIGDETILAVTEWYVIEYNNMRDRLGDCKDFFDLALLPLLKKWTMAGGGLIDTNIFDRELYPAFDADVEAFWFAFYNDDTMGATGRADLVIKRLYAGLIKLTYEHFEFVLSEAEMDVYKSIYRAKVDYYTFIVTGGFDSMLNAMAAITVAANAYTELFDAQKDNFANYICANELIHWVQFLLTQGGNSIEAPVYTLDFTAILNDYLKCGYVCRETI